MKVCIVSPRLSSYYGATGKPFFGGAEVQAAFIADALRAAGQEVVLVVSDLPGDATLPFPAINAFHSHEGLAGVRFFHPRWSGIMKALEQADADVYYQRNAGMITGLVAGFARRRRVPFVYGAGSDGDFHPRDVSIASARDRLLFRYGLRRASGFVVQNEKQLAAAQPLGKPVKLIPNGIRPAQSQPTERGDAIVWIGSLWTLKRPDRLLELARRLPDREFVVLGGVFPSEAEYSARIQNEAVGVPNVTMLGRRPHDEVNAVLARASILVNTSEVEGFPNAYLEAWSNGVPVVTFNDVDGIIAASGAGRVVASLEEMVDVLDSLRDPSVHAAMSELARRCVRDRFSPEHLGSEYVRFFDMLR